MKKTLLLFLIIYSSIAANAQIQFGLKAGLNLSNFIQSSAPIDNSFSFGLKPGFNVGGQLTIPLNNHFELQSEILYSAQGTKATTNFEEVTDRLQYINIPVLLKYKISQKLFAEIGPQAGFLLSARKKVHSTNFITENPSDYPTIDRPGDNKDIKSYYHLFELSGATGLTYFFTPNTGIQFRYSLSLLNISKANYGQLRNSVFQLNFTYLFSKKAKK